MMDKKELKEVTYSSEYVDKLERKLEQARKKNVRSGLNNHAKE